MTNEQKLLAWQEARHYANVDAFVSDVSLSTAFCVEGDTSLPSIETIKALANLWETATQPAHDLIKRCGTQTAVASEIITPLRTVHSWCATDKMPENIRWLLANHYGLI